MILPGSSLALLKYSGLFEIRRGPWTPWHTARKISGCILTFCLALYSLGLGMNLKYLQDDYEKLSMVFMIGLSFANNILKYVTILYNSLKVSEVIGFIERFEEDILQECRLHAVFARYKRHAMLMSRSFWIMVWVTMIRFYLPGVIYIVHGGLGEKPLVFGSWFPFDAQDDRLHKWAYLLEFAASLIAVFWVCTWETFYYSIIICAIGMYRVLEEMLDAISETSSIAKGELDKCVGMHSGIIRYVKDLNFMMSPVLLLDFIVYTLLLCTVGMNILTRMNDGILELVVSIELLIALLIKLLIICWYGNELRHQGSRIKEAIWRCPWYTSDIRIIKSTTIALMNAQKPICLTIGPFYDLHLGSFVMIIRSCFSLFTIIRKIYNL